MSSDDLEKKVGKEIVKTTRELLRCAKIEEGALEALYKPLFDTHVFGLEGNGAIFYHDDEIYSTKRTLRSAVTQLHQEEFIKKIEEKLQEYKQIVERNTEISSAYQTPDFTVEQAREIAKEAFKESFRKARNSYQY